MTGRLAPGGLVPAEAPTPFAASAGRVLALLTEQLGLSSAVLSRFDGQDEVVLHATGDVPVRHAPWASSPAALLLAEPRPLLLADARGRPDVLARSGPGAFAGVLLHDREGRLLGALRAHDPVPRGRLPDSGGLLTTVGAMLASLLDTELRVDCLPTDR